MGGLISAVGHGLATRQHIKAQRQMDRIMAEQAFMAQYRDWSVKPTFERRYGGLVAVVERPTNIPRVSR